MALAIVAEVEPDDAFAVEENFEALAADWDNAKAQNEGRFVGGEELATFAAVIVPFLVAFVGDVATDLAKERIKRSARTLFEKVLARRGEARELTQLRGQIEAAVHDSRFSKKQKEILRQGFGKLLAKLERGQ
mgnify:CR=1 FL=1